ncbi:MAG: ABC transporter ATP-binding protein [Anaerolineales bacterium]
MMDVPLAVEMRGIVKRFPGVLANDQADFDLQRGEIHALLGENGAGKTTLMSMLAGLYKPDAGTIRLGDETVSFRSPRDAIARGLGMIHQHFTLIGPHTVTENILLGMDKPRFLLNLAEYDHSMMDLGERFGLQITPTAKIWQLSVGEQQRVEILKMLYRGVRVLIMDEPTAVLAPQEVEELFKTLRAMAGEGKSIVFISHKLQEVMAIADRITVLRQGRVTAPGIPSASTTKEDLARMMVGRPVLFAVDRKPIQAGDVVLELEGVCAANDRGLPALREVSLKVRSGEIVGVAGVAGNGQREMADVITGLRRCTAGRIRVHGQDVTNHPALQMIRNGVSHIPEDRTHVGTAPNLSITDNLIMKTFREPPLAKGLTLDHHAARKKAVQLKAEYAIQAPNVEVPTRQLSGGNLQRVILARELSLKPRLLIAMQPTRGLDVGAIEGVQRLLLDQRNAGSAILLVSEELEEIFALSDRIVAMYEGKIVGEVQTRDPETIGMMMTGGKRSPSEAGAA